MDKNSAKGISKYSKMKLTHNKFKQTLTYCSLVRSENVRINSCNHNLQTIITNKISLSAFDNKRYIHADRVTTSPFGHKRLREDMFIREIGRTMDWGEYDVDDDAVVPTPTDNGSGEDLAEDIEAQGGYYVDIFTPPDMGFNQPTYTDQELEQDLVDFDQLSGQNESEPAAYNCPYLDIEAREENEREEIRPPKRRCLNRRAFILDDSD